MLKWQLKTFEQLTNYQLYALLKLRVDVFVVEQTCPYPELDNKDTSQHALHLLGYQDEQLVACARIVAPGMSYSNASIGRIATAQNARGHGLGHKLVNKAIDACLNRWPEHDIEIGAQEHLNGFYAKHGFKQTSEMYLEDDIPHIDMKLSR
ncbi:GNAT family N-acetyltransferase [Vibrio sonorensis]|uniref:GNAT family N-acetyltransferase n=1 Tax=Vibrio sonorensis TaxID=1004316 RepID=UPI0008DA97CA|nr:GNAT family N-acetyltransferase [Vibrio sonorensis]